MKPEEIIQLVQALKAAGVSHYKHGSMSISFESKLVQEETVSKVTQVPVDAPTPVPEEIKHQVQELTSLLKLDDVSLVDRLFPEPIAEPEEESA